MILFTMLQAVAGVGLGKALAAVAAGIVVIGAALGIGKDDEVILPDFTMIASAYSVCYTGAKPVFVDADKDTWNIDVNKIEEKVDNINEVGTIQLIRIPYKENGTEIENKLWNILHEGGAFDIVMSGKDVENEDISDTLVIRLITDIKI